MALFCAGLKQNSGMAIPKVIYQTYKSQELPLINRWHIGRFRRQNPTYAYEFYTDERIEAFLYADFGKEVTDAYRRIQVGAAKADFFRYAVLYKKGGIYLDLDSTIKKPLDRFILPEDTAIISHEANPGLYVQWALIYAAGHPFLERTLELILDNIANNRHLYDVHQLTGPSVYSEAIRQCLQKDPGIPHRVLGTDYNGYLKFKFLFSKWLYAKGEHWREQQKVKPVLKPV